MKELQISLFLWSRVTYRTEKYILIFKTLLMSLCFGECRMSEPTLCSWCTGSAPTMLHSDNTLFFANNLQSDKVQPFTTANHKLLV